MRAFPGRAILPQNYFPGLPNVPDQENNKRGFFHVRANDSDTVIVLRVVFGARFDDINHH